MATEKPGGAVSAPCNPAVKACAVDPWLCVSVFRTDLPFDQNAGAVQALSSDILSPSGDVTQIAVVYTSRQASNARTASF